MISALIPILSNVAGKIAGNLFPDAKDEQKRQEIQNKFVLGIVEQANAIEQAAAGIVTTEAASKYWLAANWRPLTMVVFVALIVARWLGYSAPGLTEAEVLMLWEIVKLGLGGYVIGRSAEKIAPVVVRALSRK